MTKSWHGAIVLGLAAALITTCSPAKLVGDPLPGALAPDFTLTDGPTGETVTLSALRGRVILVTFLYTSCYDTCPLTAETIRGARDRLGNSATDVAFLAVSVDPKGDTPETTRRGPMRTSAAGPAPHARASAIPSASSRSITGKNDSGSGRMIRPRKSQRRASAPARMSGA